MSANALGHAGASVQWHVSGGVGHAIDPDGLSLGGVFLAMALGGTLNDQAKFPARFDVFSSRETFGLKTSLRANLNPSSMPPFEPDLEEGAKAQNAELVDAQKSWSLLATHSN